MINISKKIFFNTKRFHRRGTKGLQNYKTVISQQKIYFKIMICPLNNDTMKKNRNSE